MKRAVTNRSYKDFVLTAALSLSFVGFAQTPKANAETLYPLSYSGRLTLPGGEPMQGPVDIELVFWNAVSGGTALSDRYPFPGITLNQGVFQVRIPTTSDDIAAVFGDGSKTVFIEVTAKGVTYPRQEFSFVPLALRVPVDKSTVDFNADGKLKVVLPARTSSDTVLSVDAQGKFTWEPLAVSSLQTKPVSQQAPTSGQVLTYDGSQWIPKTVTQGGSGSYLSSADWSTFNGKQNALGYTPLNKAGDTLAGALNAGGFDVSNTGNIQLAAAKTLGFGVFATDPTGLTASDKGKTWFNSTTLQVKYWDGSSAVALGVSGSGLSSLNGQSGNTQTFTPPGTTGTAPSWSSAANAHTLNIPLASAANVTAGLLSNADYSSFANKVGSVTQGNGITVATASGTATVSLATTGTAGTYALVTTDAYGRVTSGTTLSAGDIPPLNASAITSGMLPVTNGGTGAASIAAGNVMLGNGTNAVQTVAPGTNGNVLTSNGSTWQSVALPATNWAAPGTIGSTTANSGDFTSVTSKSQAGFKSKPFGSSAGETGEVQFAELSANGTNYVGFKAPDVIGANKVWVLPASDGTAGQVLKTDGAGNLGWSSDGGGTVSNVTVTAPLAVTNSASTPAISMSQASGSANGYLSSSDWTAFNTKQAAGDYVTALSGDVTTTGFSSGTVSSALASVAINGTATKVTYDAKGRVYSGTTLDASDLPPHGASLINSGAIAVANGGTGLSSIPSNGQIPIGNGTGYTLGTLTAGTGINIINAAGTVTVTSTVDTSTKVSKQGDTMSGGLSLPANGLVAGTNQLVLAGGNVGIATATPGAALDVNGQLKIQGGSPGVGKVLTSDANGLASWTTPLSGTVTSVGITPPSSGITVASGSPVTSSGNITLALANDLNAVESLATTGLAKRTAADTWTTVSDNSSDWDAAYSDRLKWDGGATGLVAATGRTSLGLGSLATLSAVSSTEITDGTIADADISASAAIADSKLATVSTAGKVSGSAITSGTIGGTTAINTSGAISTSGTITASGNVGIGTTTPTETLDIQNASAGQLRISTTATGTTGNIEFLNASNFNYGKIGVVSGTGVSNGDVFGLGFNQNNNSTFNSVLSWTSSYNVGIGTTSPNSALHVAHSYSFSSGPIFESTSTGGSSIRLKNSDTGGGTWSMISTGSANGGGAGNFGIFDGSAYRMYVTSAGNVGIGTTSPAGKLDVAGAICLNGANCITSWPNAGGYWATSGSDSYVASGKIGVGTASPGADLSFGGTLSRTIQVDRNSGAGTSGGGLTVQAGGAISGGTNYNGGTLTLASGVATGTGTSSIEFKTSSSGSSGATDSTPTTKMTILGNGNVGIGTTNPAASFHAVSNDTVNTAFVYNSGGGAGTQPALRVKTEAGSGARNTIQAENISGITFVVRDDGLVGIGTATPVTKLDIYGSPSPDFGLRDPNGGLRMTTQGGWNYIESAGSGFAGSAPLLFTDQAAAHVWMTIGASGNVGIASTTPADTLDVNGNVFRNGDRFHMALPNLTTAAWYKLGTWTATNQGGRAELLFHATNGYGGTVGTSGMTHLVMSMLNQLSTPNITGYFWSEGGVPIITDIRASTAASCSSNGQTCQSWDIYGFIQTFAGPNDNFYEVKTGGVGTWTNSMTANTPTGTVGTTQIIFSNSMSFSAGNVGIGTTAPTAALEINGSSGGTIKVKDGNQAAGKLLMSDASGVGSWQYGSGLANVTGSNNTNSASGAVTVDNNWHDFPSGTNTLSLPSAGTYFVSGRVWAKWTAGCSDLYVKWSGSNIVNQSYDAIWQACGASGTEAWNSFTFVMTVSATTTITQQYKWCCGAGASGMIAFGGASYIKIGQ